VYTCLCANTKVPKSVGRVMSREPLAEERFQPYAFDRTISRPTRGSEDGKPLYDNTVKWKFGEVIKGALQPLRTRTPLFRKVTDEELASLAKQLRALYLEMENEEQ